MESLTASLLVRWEKLTEGRCIANEAEKVSPWRIEACASEFIIHDSGARLLSDLQIQRQSADGID